MTPTTHARAGDGLIPALRGEGVMFEEPRPLVFSDVPVVVSWSPKSACTHVLTWFLAHEGLVRAAEYFDPWPHEFRGKVLYRGVTYRRAATQFLDSGGTGHTLLRITRAPHKRLVSIFRHVARTLLIKNALDPVLGRDTAVTGFSLRELGEHLTGQNLITPSPVNVHLRAQYHPLWDRTFDRVITLNMDETSLDAGLEAIEREFGMGHRKPTDFDYFNGVRARHYSRDVPYDGDVAIEDARFGADKGPGFPKSALEQAPFTRALADRLYAVDLDRVATGDTAGRLFR